MHDIAEKLGLKVVDYDFKSKNCKGLIVNKTVLLNKNIETETERKCILAEEIGHSVTTFGNIIDLKETSARKQERRARAYAYKHLIPFDRIIEAFEYGVRNRYELCEYLQVTEEFLIEALAYFNQVYGPFKIHKGYIISFDPLYVAKKI